MLPVSSTQNSASKFHTPKFGGKVSDTLYSHIERLQKQADTSFEQYPKDAGLMPNDAIYLVRTTAVRELCDLIEDICAKSKKPLKEVLTSFENSKKQVVAAYPFASSALEVIFRDFKDSQLKA